MWPYNTSFKRSAFSIESLAPFTSIDVFEAVSNASTLSISSRFALRMVGKRRVSCGEGSLLLGTLACCLPAGLGGVSWLDSDDIVMTDVGLEWNSLDAGVEHELNSIDAGKHEERQRELAFAMQRLVENEMIKVTVLDEKTIQCAVCTSQLGQPV